MSAALGPVGEGSPVLPGEAMRDFRFKDDLAKAKSSRKAAAAGAAGRHRALIYHDGFRLKVWPVLFVVFLGLFIPLLAAVAVLSVEHFNLLPQRPMMPWVEDMYQHAALLAFTLPAVFLIKPFVRADYGFHRPREKSYLVPAILWGVLLGLIMTLADHGPSIVAQTAPPGLYGPYPLNVAGWLSFEGLFSGTTEEPLYRGLLVTFLAATMPGRVGFWRYEMNAAGVVVALIFALLGLGSFFTEPGWMALGQMLCTFLSGVVFAYWLEKSRSLLAPVVGHNVGGVVEILLVFAMVAAWR